MISGQNESGGDQIIYKETQAAVVSKHQENMHPSGCDLGAQRHGRSLFKSTEYFQPYAPHLHARYSKCPLASLRASGMLRARIRSCAGRGTIKSFGEGACSRDGLKLTRLWSITRMNPLIKDRLNGTFR